MGTSAAGLLALGLILLATASPAVALAGDDPEVWTELKGGLKVQDLVVGTGEEARPGRMLQVHYTGWLEDGTQFQSSRDSGSAFAFALGQGRVVRGWEKGLVGMRAGGKRKLWIPAKLGYGKRGVPPRIPPNANLIFEIELLSVTIAPRAN